MKAKQLMNLLDWVEHYKKKGPEEMLKEVTDEQFKIMFWAVADLFKQLRNEAIRRDLWKELTTKREQ